MSGVGRLAIAGGRRAMAGAGGPCPRRLLAGAALALPLTVILLGGCAAATMPSAVPLAELSQRIATFHSSPTQANFAAILGGLPQLAADPANAALMASFIIFAAERFHLATAGAPDSPALRAFRASDRAAFQRWLDDPGSSPEKNDILWMGYFSTGDTQYLDRLVAIASADATQPGGAQGAVIDLAGATARWSYQSNAAQWPEVRAHADRLAAQGSAFAASCVAYAQAHPELMHR
jgi:hypothetical protein